MFRFSRRARPIVASRQAPPVGACNAVFNNKSQIDSCSRFLAPSYTRGQTSSPICPTPIFGIDGRELTKWCSGSLTSFAEVERRIICWRLDDVCAAASRFKTQFSAVAIIVKDSLLGRHSVEAACKNESNLAHTERSSSKS